VFTNIPRLDDLEEDYAAKKSPFTSKRTRQSGLKLSPLKSSKTAFVQNTNKEIEPNARPLDVENLSQPDEEFVIAGRIEQLKRQR
jgi:hypothetical protein